MAYTEEFRMKVVSEYESGCSMESLRRKYDIGGKSTIAKWVKKYGKKTMGEMARVPLSERLEKLELIKELEASKLKVAALEALLDAASKHTGIDIKKNFGKKE